MNRSRVLEEAAQKAEDPLFHSQCRRLEKEYGKPERRKQALEVFARLFRLAADKEKQVSWLGIQYLYSSLETQSHELLLSLYNREFYYDSEPVEVYWRPTCFFECFEEDMESVMKELRKQYPRIWRYEEEVVRRICVEYYYGAIQQLCVDLREEIMETEAFQTADKGEDFSAFFGRYRGEGEILWHMQEL